MTQASDTDKQSGRVVGDLELRAPVIVHVDHPLAEAAARLEADDQTVLVVLDGDEIVGTVSGCDMISEAKRLREPPSALRVQDVMDHRIAHCAADQPLETAVQNMISNQSRLAVVTDTQGQVKGVLTADDLAASVDDSATKKRIAEAVEEARRAAPVKKNPTGGRRPTAEPGTKPTYSEKPHVEDD